MLVSDQSDKESDGFSTAFRYKQESVYSSGRAVPPNPTELLARDGLEKAIETLKANFDYVILDTAPVGMVTDTLLIGRTADLSVYVCRADLYP